MRLLIFAMGALLGGLAYQRVNKKKVGKLAKSAVESTKRSFDLLLQCREECARDLKELNEKHLEAREEELKDLRDRLRECLREGDFNLIRGLFEDTTSATDPEGLN